MTWKIPGIKASLNCSYSIQKFSNIKIWVLGTSVLKEMAQGT
jgi:hypothetical protein